MLQKLAMVFGAVFLLIGILGFVPGITTTDESGMQMLLGIFMVDPLHNTIHIVSGVIGLLAASSAMYAMWYFWIFGAVYALVALVGLIQGNTVLGIMMVNLADNLLHVVLALGLLGVAVAVKPGGKLPTGPSAPMPGMKM